MSIYRGVIFGNNGRSLPREGGMHHQLVPRSARPVAAVCSECLRRSQFSLSQAGWCGTNWWLPVLLLLAMLCVVAPSALHVSSWMRYLSSAALVDPTVLRHRDIL